MKETVEEINSALRAMLEKHTPKLQIRKNTPENFEAAGTIEAMQGKKKVDGFYFASVMPKPKDVRLYYFPIYTHVDDFKDIPEDLRKCLKGKSCFHIKKMDKSLEKSIEKMIAKGVKLYKKDGLI